ncbi:MAG: hypothetical protein IKQ91_09720 [Oscillospiraceae bacterium]|nr:hypothetical protein [Oscillospiraceae bacterium]
MTQFDPAALRRQYLAAEAGDPRMRAMRQAITAAEQAHDDTAALRFHHDLIKESVFSGDRYQALVDFPQYLAITERNPELKAENLWDTLWMFKWIVEASTEFYQIEKVQVLRWFSEFRRELAANGYSLRTWYEKRAIFFSYCDRAKMRMDYDSFLSAPKDDMSDGTASELNSQVRFELETGNRERAGKAANQIFEGKLRTEEVPCKTYYYLLGDALANSDDAAADQYARLLRPLCNGARFQLEPIGMMLCYDAVRDPAAGLQFYAQNLPLRTGSRNPFLCYWFDRGAARLLAAAADAGCTLRTKTGAEMSAAQLAEKAESTKQSAAEIAAKFDARNGSDYFMSRL